MDHPRLGVPTAVSVFQWEELLCDAYNIAHIVVLVTLLTRWGANMRYAETLQTITRNCCDWKANCTSQQDLVVLTKVCKTSQASVVPIKRKQAEDQSGY